MITIKLTDTDRAVLLFMLGLAVGVLWERKEHKLMEQASDLINKIVDTPKDPPPAL